MVEQQEERDKFMTTVSISTQNGFRPVLSVYGGRYYSGMTRTEAVQRGIDKRILGRDFIQIDRNKDGILSDEEILNERVTEKRRAGIEHSLITAGLALWTIADFNKEAFKKSKPFEVCMLALDISLIAIELLNSIRNFVGLKKAKETLNNYQTVIENINQVEH